MQPNVVVVVPAHNEAARIQDLLPALPASIAGAGTLQALVVDDGSADDTSQRARDAGALVVRHRVNLGYGAAVMTGTEAALQTGAQIIVHMDADGQHSPEDLPALLLPLTQGADVTFGQRSFAAPMPRLMRVGNHFLSWMLRLLFRVPQHDSQCGFRAFRAEVWPALKWESRGYATPSEIVMRAKQNGLRSESVPIRTIYLDPFKGTTVGDGFKILGKYIQWRIST